MNTKDIDQAHNSAMHFFGNLSKLSANGAAVGILYAIDYLKPKTIVERNQESTSQSETEQSQSQNVFPILTVARQKFDNVIERGRQGIGQTRDGFRRIGEESQALPGRFAGSLKESFNNVKMAFSGQKYAAQVDNLAASVTEPVRDLGEAQTSVLEPAEDLGEAQTFVTEPVGDLGESQTSVLEPAEDSAKAQTSVPKSVEDLGEAQTFVTEPVGDLGESQTSVLEPAEDLPAQPIQTSIDKFNHSSQDQSSGKSGGKKQMDSSDDSIYFGDSQPAMLGSLQESEFDSFSSATSSNPQFLYSVHPVRGSQAKMDNKDAAAIASLLYSKKGDRVEGGAGLIIRSGKEILFQVDRNGIVQKSAFEERPGLMTDQRMMKAYGISNLKQYADFLSNTNASDTEVLRDSGNSDGLSRDDIDRVVEKIATDPQPSQSAQNNQPAETLTAIYNKLLEPRLSEQGKETGSVKIDDRVQFSVVPSSPGDSFSVKVKIDSKTTTLAKYSKDTGMVISRSFANDRSLQNQMKQVLSQRNISIDSPVQKETPTVDNPSLSVDEPISVNNPSLSADEAIPVDNPVQQQAEMD